MIQSINNAPQALFNDTKAITSIKYQNDQGDALTKAAKQFEAMLYQQILKSMRASTDLINSDENALSTQNQGVMRDMYDGQLALQMAQGGPGSISEMLVSQLSGFKGETVNHIAINNEISFKQLNANKEPL